MTDPFNPKEPITDEEREAWKALVTKLRADRQTAEQHAAQMHEELQRRDVSDYHIAQMVKLGLRTDRVIYMQAVLNALKFLKEGVERHTGKTVDLESAPWIVDCKDKVIE